MPAATVHIKRNSLSDVWASPVSGYSHVLQDHIALRGALTVLPIRGNVEWQKNWKNPKGFSPCVNYTMALDSFGRPMTGTEDLQPLPKDNAQCAVLREDGDI